MKRFFIISILFGILGCDAVRTDHKRETVTANDATLVDALLRMTFPDSISNNVTFMIDREISIDMITGEMSKSRFAADLTRSVRHDKRLTEAVSAFCRRNKRTHIIDSFDELSVKHVIVAGEQGSDLFAAKNVPGWKEFFRTHPMTPKLIMLSLPGFSTDGTLAVIYMGAYFRGLAGGGFFYVLERKEGQWIVIKKNHWWAS